VAGIIPDSANVDFSIIYICIQVHKVHSRNQTESYSWGWSSSRIEASTCSTRNNIGRTQYIFFDTTEHIQVANHAVIALISLRVNLFLAL